MPDINDLAREALALGYTLTGSALAPDAVILVADAATGVHVGEIGTDDHDRPVHAVFNNTQLLGDPIPNDLILRHLQTITAIREGTPA